MGNKTWKKNNTLLKNEGESLREGTSVGNYLLEELENCEYVNIGNFYAFTDEDCYDNIRSMLEEEGIDYSADENSYAGIYAIMLP